MARYLCSILLRFCGGLFLIVESLSHHNCVGARYELHSFLGWERSLPCLQGEPLSPLVLLPLCANLVGLSSSTKKGEIERIIFSPYVFGVDDNSFLWFNRLSKFQVLSSDVFVGVVSQGRACS